MSEELGKMLLSIATHYSSKGNFSGYTWKQDMVAEAVFTCIRYLKNFNPEKSTNAFAYVTQIIKNSFKLYITNQKTHSKIKKLCYQGFERYQEENKMSYQSDKSLNYESILLFAIDDEEEENKEICDVENDTVNS